jgi:hypothetical protein
VQRGVEIARSEAAPAAGTYFAYSNDVRFLVVASCVAAFTTGPALACPRSVLCVVKPDVAVAREVAQVAKPSRVSLDVRRVHLAPRDRLTFDAPAKPDPSVVEMPWIWRVLRERVVSTMPSHRSRGLSVTMQPVVVTTPAETVPGVGIGGDF